MPRAVLNPGPKNLVAIQRDIWTKAQKYATKEGQFVNTFVNKAVVYYIETKYGVTVSEETDSGPQEEEKDLPWSKEFILDSHHAKMSGDKVEGEELKAANYWSKCLQDKKLKKLGRSQAATGDEF